jgi:hypothetical protein
MPPPQVIPDERGSASALAQADVVLFHVKTHNKGSFPAAKGKPDQKWTMVSLEQVRAGGRGGSEIDQ